MRASEKDGLAELVIDQHCAFEQALAGSRKRYPTREFESFAAVMRQYVDATREDEMLHRCVVRAVNGLVEYLRSECKWVPDEALPEAERLECLLFFGYDPHFDGDEPPGLIWPPSTSAILSCLSLVKPRFQTCVVACPG
jgi:hypothetical protein